MTPKERAFRPCASKRRRTVPCLRCWPPSCAWLCCAFRATRRPRHSRGKHAWDTAAASPITRADVQLTSKSAVAALDESFFRVRFDRLTPVEKRYLRAMADLGPGPHRSGDIAEKLGRSVQSFGPTRSNLILKGMIWSPTHGDTAFTVPLFDEFMKRIMPGDDWKSA